MWVSTDRGENWDIKSSGLEPDSGILISYGINSQGYVYAGQDGGNIYRTVNSTIGLRKLSENVPVYYILYQNYPNPFNPSTTIKFDVPHDDRGKFSKVKIIIYDALGKEAAKLLNEDLSPGTYELNWNASNYPSGVYFYRLIVNDFMATNKMILLK